MSKPDLSTEGLSKQVLTFHMLELPGQPRMMHMGTSYLVDNLMSAIRERDAALRTRDAELERAGDEIVSLLASVRARDEQLAVARAEFYLERTSLTRELDSARAEIERLSAEVLHSYEQRRSEIEARLTAQDELAALRKRIEDAPEIEWDRSVAMWAACDPQKIIDAFGIPKHNDKFRILHEV